MTSPCRALQCCCCVGCSGRVSGFLDFSLMPDAVAVSGLLSLNGFHPLAGAGSAYLRAIEHWCHSYIHSAGMLVCGSDYTDCISEQDYVGLTLVDKARHSARPM